MNREEKAALVSEMQQVFQDAKIVVITHNQGLTVSESTALRQKMRAVGASYKVTKNRVVKRALAGTPFESLEAYFQGPTAIAWSDDPVAAAKVTVDFAKTNEKLQLVTACMDGKILDANAIKALATLPPLDVLRGQLIGILQTPASNIAQLTKASASGLARQVAGYQGAS